MMKKKFLSIGLVLSSFLFPLIVKANPYKSTGPYGVNCTWYVWDKVLKFDGISLPAWGNAKTWYNSAKNAGYKVGNTVKNNSILVGNITEYGHVAYVEKVSDNFMYVWDADRPCIDEEDPEFIECDKNSYDEASQSACRKQAKKAACKLDINIHSADYKVIGYIYLDEVPKLNETSKASENENTITSNKDKNTIKESSDNKEEVSNVKSDNNYLQEIKVSVGEINFDQNVLEYNLIVDYDIQEIEISALASDTKSKVNGNGKYELEVGDNQVKLTVTAENGEARDYTIHIIREENKNIDSFPENNDAYELGKDNNEKKEAKEVSKYFKILLSIGALITVLALGLVINKKQ